MTRRALVRRTVVHPGTGSAVASFPSAQPSATPGRARALQDGLGVGMLDTQLAPYALWLLRLTVGAVFLQHVMRMVFGYEPADTTQLFALPPGVSPYAVAWEALIALGLIYGFWPRLAAIAGAVTLTVATIGAHGAATSAYGWQNPVLWVAALLAYALAGDGAFALVPSRWRLGAERRA